MEPSLIATTDKAEREVVVELGVPGPISLGVAGSEGGGGTMRSLWSVSTSVFGSVDNIQLIKVGPLLGILAMERSSVPSRGWSGGR